MVIFIHFIKKKKIQKKINESYSYLYIGITRFIK